MAIKNHVIERAAVGHNSAEFYIRLGEFTLILPPAAAKNLKGQLAALHISARPGAIEALRKEKRTESISKQILKALYKGRKVTKTLVSINTTRRKKLPDV